MVEQNSSALRFIDGKLNSDVQNSRREPWNREITFILSYRIPVWKWVKYFWTGIWFWTIKMIFWLQSDVLPSPHLHEFVVKQPIAIKRYHIFILLYCRILFEKFVRAIWFLVYWHIRLSNTNVYAKDYMNEASLFRTQCE